MLDFIFGTNDSQKEPSLDDLKKEFRDAVLSKPQNPEKIADLLCSLKPDDRYKAMQHNIPGFAFPRVTLKSDGTMDFLSLGITLNSEYCKNRKPLK